MKNMEISEHILIAQDMIHSIEKKVRGANVVIKLNMTKAFDKVSWAFLEVVLERFGFNDHFMALFFWGSGSTKQHYHWMNPGKIYAFLCMNPHSGNILTLPLYILDCYQILRKPFHLSYGGNGNKTLHFGLSFTMLDTQGMAT
ncbi:unnamed protein product [Cuscuta epithymum]|uniref:Reverse transcriptase domain-containing protein n=1 Tax=Cuscuta epithymum TaxID=186058 RepID=A0AAV0CY70_9ASTE|nr:unnamed protein product [Cuscuta epithymum]